jgi:hypothetical protein
MGTSGSRSRYVRTTADNFSRRLTVATGNYRKPFFATLSTATQEFASSRVEHAVPCLVNEYLRVVRQGKATSDSEERCQPEIDVGLQNSLLIRRDSFIASIGNSSIPRVEHDVCTEPNCLILSYVRIKVVH